MHQSRTASVVAEWEVMAVVKDEACQPLFLRLYLCCRGDMASEESSDKAKYSESIGIRLDPEDSALLKAYARKRRTPPSVLVRDWIGEKLDELRDKGIGQELSDSEG